jgi:hypothetical protein
METLWSFAIGLVEKIYMETVMLADAIFLLFFTFLGLLVKYSGSSL